MFNHWFDITSFATVRKYLDLDLAVNTVVTYHSKVKLHGSNAAVQITPNGTVRAQSRSQLITPGNDNAGFAKWVWEGHHYWTRLANADNVVTVYGEWCGPGIQKGTAVNQIGEKSFAIFSIQYGSSDDPNALMYIEPKDIQDILGALLESTYVLPWYSAVWVDFADTSNMQVFIDFCNEDVDTVEKCDPWVYHNFGVEGLGEGLVYYPTSLGNKREDLHRYIFKAKGEKHKVVKTKKSVELDPEIAASMEEFTDQVITEGRLNQAVSETNNEGFNDKGIGPFVGWISKDVKKDIDNGEVQCDFDWKVVCKVLTKRAVKWYKEQL